MQVDKELSDFQTTNILERTNKEIKRSSNVVGAFPVQYAIGFLIQI
ncbi:MAG: transposase [Methanotrichaceae archaeon]